MDHYSQSDKVSSIASMVDGKLKGNTCMNIISSLSAINMEHKFGSFQGKGHLCVGLIALVPLCFQAGVT